jgi:hypothetical protein
MAHQKPGATRPQVHGAVGQQRFGGRSRHGYQARQDCAGPRRPIGTFTSLQNSMRSRGTDEL